MRLLRLHRLCRMIKAVAVELVRHSSVLSKNQLLEFRKERIEKGRPTFSFSCFI